MLSWVSISPFSVLGLDVQQIARIENRFGPNRQTKARQFLSDLNAQRGIVNSQTSGKRIDGKHSRVWREAQHGADVCAGVKTGAELQRRRLEKAALKDFGWVAKCRRLRVAVRDQKSSRPKRSTRGSAVACKPGACLCDAPC